jgi:WhiB family transcriptional regulator, redox-sensing transcriptional regulator
MGRQPNSRPGISVDFAWRDEAGCRFADLELFFPSGPSGQALEETQAAKAICSTCQVKEQCLRFALETNQEDGIWGGTTATERRKLRRTWLANRRRPRPAANVT